MISRRGLHKTALAVWVIAGVLFAVFCFTGEGGIVPGLMAIAITVYGAVLSLKKFPPPKG